MHTFFTDYRLERPNFGYKGPIFSSVNWSRSDSVPWKYFDYCPVSTLHGSKTLFRTVKAEVIHVRSQIGIDFYYSSLDRSVKSFRVSYPRNWLAPLEWDFRDVS